MKICLMAVMLVTLVVSCNATPYWVPATADIYLAGQPAGTVITDSIYGQSDSAPGQAAFEITGVALYPSASLTFAVDGFAVFTTGGSDTPPDGDRAFLTSYDPLSGVGKLNGEVRNQVLPVPFAVSGHSNIPLAALIGVFTSDVVPVVGSPSVLPPSLDYGQIGLDFQTVSPELRQIFFIGDGKTSDGFIQRFVIPQGSTHLYLGINDGPGAYCNNAGGFSVDITPVPEPSGLLALASGFGILGGAIRRRRK